MKIRLIAHTSIDRNALHDESDGKWDPFDASDSAALSEFSGRQCYESWSRPNPATATNDNYIANIIRAQHTSVLEHGTASFRISQVSRSLTHELIRHRHFSYSQLSQRYVRADPEAFVVPPLYRDDPESQEILRRQWLSAIAAYDELYDRWFDKLSAAGQGTFKARKQAREAARAVLPNMTPTAIVMSGNHLAWRQLIAKRHTEDADAEIREVAGGILRALQELEPALYQDC